MFKTSRKKNHKKTSYFLAISETYRYIQTNDMSKESYE